jgi:hypothetical protein
MVYGVLYFVVALLNFLAAGFLWRNASKFSGTNEEPTSDELLTSVGALRIAIIAIAAYHALGRLDQVVDWLATLFTSGERGQVAYLFRGGYSLGGLVTFGVAVITIIVIVKGQAVRRFYSYVIDPEEPPHPT